MRSTVFFLFLWLLGDCSWALSEQTVEVVTFYYPPYMMAHSQSENVVGIMPEILEACLKGTNFKPHYRVYPIKRAVLEMHKAESWRQYLHLGTPANFEDEILQKKVSTIDFTVGKFAAFVSRGRSLGVVKPVTLGTLKQYQVAALRGSVIVPRLKSEGVRLLEVSDLELLFKVLKMGRVDVAVVLEKSGEYFLQGNPGYSAIQVPGVLFEAPLSLMISKEHPHYEQLHFLITKNLKKLKSTGDLRRIEYKSRVDD